MNRLLITGAAGSIGSCLRETLRGKYLLRLSDVNPISTLAVGEEFVATDVTDAAAMPSLMEGVHGVVHLGGVSREDAWEPILDINIVGTSYFPRITTLRACLSIIARNACSSSSIGRTSLSRCPDAKASSLSISKARRTVAGRW